MAVSSLAMDLRAQGRAIIALSVGGPDFVMPEHSRQAARQAIDDGFTRYTQVPGFPELRNAVVGYFKQQYGVDAAMDNTVVTNGGKQALYNLFLSLLDDGDEVLLPSPYWVSYPAMIQLAGGVTVAVPTRIENDFKVTVDELDQALSGKTRMLVMNSPSNPVGCCYTQAELDAIADWAVAKGVFIVSDEVYDQLVFAPAKPASLSPTWAKHPENVAIVNALSKTFAMTGLRVGFALAHPDVIKAMSKLQGQSTSNVCSIAQKAAVAALTGSFDEVARMREAFAKRRDLVVGILNSWPNVTCPRPDGAFYVFPRVEAYFNDKMPDSTTMCQRLLEEVGVATVPGTAFGEDSCIRLSYALDEATLTRALDLVGSVFRG